MPAHVSPEQKNDAFDLYLEYNGERFDLIEEEMWKKGWTKFSRQSLTDRGTPGTKHFREGWINRFGWKHALEVKVAIAGTVAATSAESLLFEVEVIRKKLFQELQTGGVNNRDLVYQHDKYVQRSTEILAQLDSARDNYANFNFFLKHLLAAAMKISPALGKELCDAEDAIIAWAEQNFVIDEESE